MAKETIGRGMEEEVPYTSVVFYSNISASKGIIYLLIFFQAHLGWPFRLANLNL